MACEEELTTLLLHIGEDLVEGNVRELLYLIGDGIPKSEKERISTGRELMDMLIKKHLVDSNRLERLKSLLSGIDREDLKVQLEPFEQKIKSINTAKHSLTLNGLVPNFIKTSQCIEVEERLKNEQLAILTGISASGKSQICIWYASEFQKNAKHTAYKLMCQNEDDLLTSMRSFLEFLGMKFERQKEAKDVYIKHMAEVVKSLTESGNKTGQHYLFIFDDVTETTCKVVELIIHSFREAQNVKIICSTSYSKFYEQCTERNVFVKVKGVSQAEALQFFKEHVKMNNSQDNIQALAIKMGYLPYGLVLANSYIFTTGVSVKKYVELLTRKDFLRKVEQLTAGTAQEYDKGLVSAQMLTVDKVESSSVHIKSLLNFIPFLHHNEIPTRLLRKLLPENIDDRDKDIVILDFIANVKKYCIGEIESTDQTETISIHAVTALVLEHRLPLEEQESSIKALLCFFCKNISIDCRLHLTFTSNMEFQPHASKAALRAVEMESSKTKDCTFLLCALHAAIGVTFRVGGVESLLADENLNKAKALCFQLINENDPESYMLTAEERDSLENTEYVDESKKTFRREDLFQVFLQETMKNEQKGMTSRKTELENEREKCRQNARAKDSKAETLYKRLVEVPQQLTKGFIADIVLKTERSEPDLAHLVEVAGFTGTLKEVDERKRGRLSKELYDKLLTQNLAINRDQLGSICVVELMVIILYNNGRHHYYQCQSEQQLFLVCWNELRLAYLLGELLQEHYSDFPSVQSLITRRNGILYHCLLSNQQTNESGEESGIVLDKIIRQYEKMLGAEKSEKYFEYGIIKVSHHQRLHHDAMCLKLLLKCYTNRMKDGPEKDQHYEDGKKHANKLEELLKDKRMCRWLAVPGFHVQIARFFFEHEMEKAIIHFKRAVELEEEYSLQRLSHFKLQGQFGLIECYLSRKEGSDLEDARGICELLKRSLHESNFQRSYHKVVKYLEDISNHQRDINTGMGESTLTSKRNLSHENQTIIYERASKRKPDAWKYLQKSNDL
ncbi:uncharacterized protein LOC110465493 [Mizuhopecten yessoensis]|uniref:DED domain-containing protein n=1 Tax=Mizuhopecten yessoensis TaxID=6573 RepID=A0A210PRG4_MIZYE|nr:uncharacterized protein LOC110465493 [Mizuhopecten yessoensis]OWF39083.1 hypothetical protein KP79_PYT08100 [Mizuhopecten yessoensis]